MTSMMYYYWVNGRLRPSFFNEMSHNELTIVRAFFELEIDEINQSGKG